MSQQNRQLQKYARRQISKLPAWAVILIIAAVCGLYLLHEHTNTPDIPEGQLTVRFIDVGQGDCELLSADGGTVLIDAGPTSAQYSLTSYLSRCVSQIDYLILTHPHEDHIGGAAQVIGNFDVRNVIMPDAVSDSASFSKLLDAMEDKNISGILAEPGSEYTLGELKITILAPLSDEYEDTNNYSIVLRADYGEDSFLFTGDAETPVEKELLTAYPSHMLDCDVLKVGHHGSTTSSSAAFLDAVTPEIAVIEVGKDNDYGHPKEKILSRLSEYTSQIYRTDTDSTVVLVSNGQGISRADQ